VLPFLSNILAIEQAIINTSSNATAVAESQNKQTQLVASISGWQSVLDRNSQLMTNASTGKLQNYEVTHLVADALLQDEKGVDNVKYINGTKAPDANKLRSISAISFGGAGALITYTDTSTNSTTDASTSSTTLQDEAGLVFENKLMFGGFGLYATSSLLHQGLYDDTDGSTESSDKSRMRSFSLGDADQGDYFDVQVFTDPVFGSYVFNTMSGQSR
jgi:hypothetical protein